MHAVDWLPTLAALARVKPEGKKLDGVNQLEAFKRKTVQARTGLFLGHSRTAKESAGCHSRTTGVISRVRRNLNATEGRALRAHSCSRYEYAAYRYKNFKLLRYPNKKKYTLHNLKQDRREMRDVKKFFPKEFFLMKRRLALAELSLPGNGPPPPKCPRYRLGITPWGEKAVRPWCGV